MRAKPAVIDDAVAKPNLDALTRDCPVCGASGTRVHWSGLVEQTRARKPSSG